MNATADTTTALGSKSANANEQDFSRQLRGYHRPQLGPALWTFGVLLWMFTVAGEFTTAGFVGEGVSMALVLGVTGVTALIASRRSLAVLPGKLGRRAALTAVLALAIVTLFAIAAVFCLQLLNLSSDVVVTLFLLAIGAAAAFCGRRWTGEAKAPTPKFVRVSLATATVAVSMATIVHVLAVN